MRKTKLIEFRKAHGLSQEQMSRELNVSLSLYFQVEQGYVAASRKFMERIKAKYPEADINELFFS